MSDNLVNDDLARAVLTEEQALLSELIKALREALAQALEREKALRAEIALLRYEVDRMSNELSARDDLPFTEEAEDESD